MTRMTLRLDDGYSDRREKGAVELRMDRLGATELEQRAWSRDSKGFHDGCRCINPRTPQKNSKEMTESFLNVLVDY